MIIDEGAYDAIAERALKLNTGARSLASILSEVLKPILFEEIDGKSKTITVQKDLTYKVKIDKEDKFRLML